MVHPYEEIRAWAARWSQEWFLGPDGEDRFQVGGVSAGWATHVDAFESLMSHAARHWLRSGEQTASGLFAKVKRVGLDRVARTTALRVLARPSAASIHKGAPALIIEVPTTSMLEPALLTIAALQGQATVGAADPRAYRRLRASGARPAGLYLPWRQQQSALRQAARDVSRARDHLLQHPPPIVFRDRDVTREVLNALDHLITRSMPWLGPERASLASFMDLAQPRAIAVASDQHRIGRIVSELARATETQVVVLQHGLPQMRIGLLPVVADRVATWSQASNEWFVGHGTDLDHLTVTGNPRLDALISLDREKSERDVQAELDLDGAPRLLLILSPTAADVNRHVADVAIRAVETLTPAALIIKLHPGQGSWSEIQSMARTSPARARIRIQRQTPIAPLLGWASAVLLHRSTVAVEALAARTPVGAIDVPGAASGAELELAPLELPRCSTPRDVVEWITGDLDRETYLARRRPAIERLAGPLDGSSAARIAGLLSARPPASR